MKLVANARYHFSHESLADLDSANAAVADTADGDTLWALESTENSFSIISMCYIYIYIYMKDNIYPFRYH